MTRTPKTPAASTVETSAPPTPGAGAIPESSTIVHHDATIQWVLSDHMALGETPEPIPVGPLPSAQPEPEAQPESPKAPEAWNEASPLLFDRTLIEETPPVLTMPLASPAAGLLGEEGNAPTATKPQPEGAIVGATPEDFFTAGPTPPAPSPAVFDEVPPTSPASPVGGTPLGDSADLPSDAVELLPASGDELTAAAAVPADSPGEVGIGSEPSPALTSVDSQAIEIGEVEPEALMPADSSLHVVEPAEAPAKPSPSTTPPPVPEAALAASQRTNGQAEPRHVARPSGEVGADVGAMPLKAAEIVRQVEAESAAEAPPTITPKTEPEEPNGALSDSPASQILAAALFEEYQTPEALEDAVPEALARRSLQKRSKPWYEEVFGEDYLRTVPFMTAEQTAREVDFIAKSLALPPGGAVLDLACGYGRHAIEMSQRGFQATGLDLSLPLLIKAADEAQKRGLTVNFMHADMREMEFNGTFDGAYCVLSSFGYFDEETNLRVASAVCRALKPGARFLLDIINRDYLVGDLPSRVWWEGDGCVVLEEVDFNYHTSRILIRRSVVFGDGRQNEQEVSMRAYSLHEVGRLLRHAGLRVLDVSGSIATKSRFFGAASKSIIALCERPLP